EPDDRAVPRGRVDEHDAGEQLRLGDGGVHRDPAAQAVADEDRPVQLLGDRDSGHLGGPLADRVAAGFVAAVPVAAQVDRDDPVTGQLRRDVVPPRRGGRRTVHQQHAGPGALTPHAIVDRRPVCGGQPLDQRGLPDGVGEPLRRSVARGIAREAAHAVVLAAVADGSRCTAGASRLSIRSQASVTMRSTSSRHDGTSWMSPWDWPAHHIPSSMSPSVSTRVRPRLPETSSATSSNVLSGRDSMSITVSETAFLASRAGLRNLRNTRLVARSSLATICRLTLSCTGASWVATNLVPMFTASAPSASAATNPRASAIPPLAITGMDRAAVAAGISTSPPMSSSPGCPAHSNPSMLTASTPSRSALIACRTLTHLWITLAPAARNAGMCGSGLRPAVSNSV